MAGRYMVAVFTQPTLELAVPELDNGLPRSFVCLNHEQTCAWWETLDL